jgi:hypothetical protein
MTPLLDRLVATTPDVARRWRAECESGGVGPDEPYNVAGALAHVLFELRADQAVVLGEVFRALERELSAADAGARNLLIVGLLEDLQNISLNDGVGLDYWEPWLGPVTLAAWKTLEGLWSGTVSPADFNAFVDTV